MTLHLVPFLFYSNSHATSLLKGLVIRPSLRVFFSKSNAFKTAHILLSTCFIIFYSSSSPFSVRLSVKMQTTVFQCIQKADSVFLLGPPCRATGCKCLTTVNLIYVNLKLHMVFADCQTNTCLFGV